MEDQSTSSSTSKEQQKGGSQHEDSDEASGHTVQEVTSTPVIDKRPLDETLRKTSRKNAGVPPPRLGSPVNQRRPYKKKEARKSAQTAPPPISTKSTSSARLKKQADVEADTQIAEWEREYDESEKAAMILECDFEEANRQARRFAAMVKNPQPYSADEQAANQAQLDKFVNERDQLQNDLARARVDLQFQQKEFWRKREAARNGVALEKLRIDEDSDSDSNRGSIVDRTIDTEEWARRTRKESNSDTGSEVGPEDKAPHREGQRHTSIGQGKSKKVSYPSPAPAEKMLARQTQGRDLPRFHGQPEEWPSFISAYETTSKNCYYTNADNLPRLQRALKGEALRTVQCLLINPEAVPKAIEKLRMRFGRPTQIIEAMIHKVRDVSTVKIDRSETFVDFGIAVDNLVSTIKAMDKPEHLTNPTLIQELTKKLPLITQMDWIQKRTSDTPTLEEFSAWFDHYTEAACELSPPQSNLESNKSDRGKNRKKSERVFATNEDKGSSKKEGRSFPNQRRKCLFCDKDHNPRECPDLKSSNLEGRIEMVKKKRACFGCLNGGHRFKECRSKRECGTNGCKRMHHKLLHEDKPQVPPTPTETKEESSSSEDVNCARDAVNSIRVGRINFMMTPVKLNGPDGVIDGFAVLDNYSSITMVESSTAQSIGAPGRSKSLNVQGFGGSSQHPNSRAVKLQLVHHNQPEVRFKLKNVRTVERLDLPRQSLHPEDLLKWKHLEGLEIEPFNNARPTILVGMDNPQLHIHLEYRKSSNPNAPIAVRTPLGWMLMGKLDQYSKHDYAFPIHEKEDLHNLVKEFFTTESFGVLPNAPKPRSKDDQRAQAILDSSLRRIEHGWETGLLWKEDNVTLPQSKAMAFHRLMNMEKKMDRDQEFAKQYVERISEYEAKGFARKLPADESTQESSKTFYLPHFMAFNPKKPKKYRFVFDAAAQVKGKSLNSFLLQGPDKLASLPGILLQFRQRKIGITADIQDMFHRVRVKPDDAQAQRFLWRGMDRDRPPDVMEMSVLVFGASCSPACAQEAKNRNALDLQQRYPEAYDPIVKKHYVDDYLNSHDTEEDAIHSQEIIRKVHSLGGFNLCNWLSSSRTVMDAIPEELRAKSMKSLDMSAETPMERVLGLFWKPGQDLFTFSLTFLKGQEEVLNGKKIPTKREILSLVMSLYDPLGFLSILTVKAKILIQQAWRKHLEWDEKIPDDLVHSWKQWFLELDKIPTFGLPRCYSHHFSSADEIQLHVFGDAGEEAFGAVCYFRIDSQNQIEVSLVMSKSKVAPIKVLSIPRLELQAAVMGARLAAFIKSEIEVPIDRVVYWSDSTSVLGWIQSDGKRYQQFVSHRVGEIQEMTDPGQWKYVPTNLNVADEMTRFDNPCNWSTASRWITGPEFLYKPESEWPSQEIVKKEGPQLEMRKQFVMSIGEYQVNLIDLSRFSNWWRLLRTTAYLLRYVAKTKRSSPHIGIGIHVMEILAAEKYWWKLVQQQFYSEEISSLKNKLPIMKGSKLHKINLILDNEGILRVKGRITNADIPQSLKHPVVLDKRSLFTKLLIRHYHQLCGHHGQERIGNEIRQLYFIPGLRHEVRSTQNHCQVCRNDRAKPRVPEMGQLPRARLEKNVRPFTKTGLDYFGPIEVIVKRSREKRYVALFTCLSTRAVHLEVANFLSTDSCIMAIRRFVSRRGCPEEIFSDNGTNFHGSHNELKAALNELDQSQIKDECTNRGFTWNFNPPSAPHMGGSWERMVRSVKVALGNVLQSKILKDELLHTLMTEAEHTVNSHPLTHVPDDPEDSEALTPNHFLIGCSSNLQPLGQFSKDDLYGRKEWRIVQQMADQFWRRWVREYLPTLMRREKWCEPAKPIKEGDVIVEINQNLHRNFWPKARVIKTYPGADGIIRVVDIKHSNGRIYRRPVSKLCVLDLEASQDKEEKINAAN